MNTKFRDRILKRLREAEDGAGILLLGPMRVVRHSIEGRRIFFAISHPDDHIQRVHVKSGFYEPEELEIIRSAFPKGGRFVDIGANVGNHSLFVGLFLDPEEIIAIEPNPVAFKLFANNMILNGIEGSVDLSFLGMGLTDKPSEGFGIEYDLGNIGGGRMSKNAGEIAMISGDTMIGDRRADFIKIDVEGMEMLVLRGLEATVRRDYPRMFIEVDNENADEFDAWTQEYGYRKAARFKRYEPNENFLLVHESDDFGG